MRTEITPDGLDALMSGVNLQQAGRRKHRRQAAA